MIVGKGNARQAGFTIVELLIVIVVIAILAVIVVVAYNGIQQQARVSVVQADLGQAKKQLEMYKQTQASGSYPALLSSTSVKTNGGTQLDYVYDRTNNTYCIRGAQGTTSYYLTNTLDNPQQGTCTITNYARNPQVVVNHANFATQTPVGNTYSRVAGVGPAGEAVYRVALVNSGQVRINVGLAVLTAQPGDQFNVSFWMHSSLALTDAYIQCGFGTAWVDFPIEAVTNGWKRYSAVVTVPTGAVSVQACQFLSSNSVSVPAGTVFMVTKVQATQGPTLYEFADGETPGWTWSGAQYSSTSSGPSL